MGSVLTAHVVFIANEPFIVITNTTTTITTPINNEAIENVYR